MSDELRLGKKGENVDLSKIKGGIRRDDIKDEKLKNIFDKYDKSWQNYDKKRVTLPLNN